MKIKLSKIITLSFLFLLTCYSIQAQEINLSDPLPVNEKIKKGVLENGMTYYIYNTDVTKNAASYYIIQNVGSVLENDNQQGLAHFLEHMAFNGTENFEGKGILDTLQKHGIVFGKEINAYTSFDETVYNINNVPTTDELVDTALLILNDWSNYLLLTEEEIDAERGVIKEEWRTGQSGRRRVSHKSAPTLFNNAIYAKRMPIGLMKIVENFDYNELRDFYYDWYRTDLQAIAVIGDIDVDEIEKKIIKQFSHIPAVDNPKERFTVEIEENEDMLYSMVTDEEITTSNITFKINHPKTLKNRTIGDFKTMVINNMITSLLSSRLAEKSQDPEASFTDIRVNYGNLSRANNQFSVRIAPKKNQQDQAFKDALVEVNRAVKFGFTQEEINRTIVQFKNYYETQITKINDIPHKRIIRTIQSNYLENSTMTDIIGEFEIAKAIFNNLTKDEVHQAIKNLYTQKNRAVLVTGVKGNNNLTEERAIEIINEVENDQTIKPYKDAFEGKTLLSGTNIVEGSIVSEKKNDEIGSTTFILSNGVVVHYKFADKNKNEVKLNAISYGGNSLINDADLPSAGIVGNLVQLSGLGEFSNTDLRKVLAGKTASTSIGISDLTENVSGSSSTKDLETMLQMVYLRFEKPRFEENSYKVLLGQINSYMIRKSSDINQKMQDSITISLYGDDHPTKRLFNKEYVEDFSFEKTKSIYEERFKDASDFEFFIVGDVSADNLKPLLTKYIASIKTSAVKEEWVDNSVSWLEKNTDKDIFLKMEDPKSSVRIVYMNDIDYSLKNKIIARAIGDILKLRFTETLREQEGGTYGASARASVSKRPKQEGYISVAFDCNPDKVDKLVSIVHAEINKIANGEAQQVDLDKSLKNYLKERTQQKNYNSYDMNLLVNYYREGYDMNNPENFENLVNSITIKDLQKLADKILKDARSYEFVFKPE